MTAWRKCDVIEPYAERKCWVCLGHLPLCMRRAQNLPMVLA